ncbi:WcbI family polysaccharide biosynthesis putative acetyltransferase [Subtercola sp. Z020]|uniref:WcbI family polysaccharide biosynthesis putative acetyltransferase n=1 Tax=Subtercola sp. Z020 TaxID=2080582 RepID=UPI00130DB31E|nr:WcbI family polysaccharide biosynthesis putative acetyltransferase [Subtercola sp. Z020]
MGSVTPQGVQQGSQQQESPQAPTPSDARRLHYGEFYGLLPIDGDEPLAVVSGNCQAESLRIMLDGGGLRTVRVPPIFELEAADVPHLERLLSRTAVFVSQPVRDGYHGLPIGTAELTALLPPGSQAVRMPVVRFAGLYPFHAIVRPPFDDSLVPPVVEYHDLRTVMQAWAASGSPDARPSIPGGDPVTADRVRAVADQSIAELQKREQHHDTVVVSDLFGEPAFDLMRTINHPGNRVWSVAAERVRARLGLPEHDVDPGRPLLDTVHAPREAVVLEAFGIDDAPTANWTVNGREVPAAEVERAHLAWYAEHPSVVPAAIARHRLALETLGLLPAGSAL